MVYRRFLVDRGNYEERIGFERGTLMERRPERIRDTTCLIDDRHIARYTLSYRATELSVVSG